MPDTATSEVWELLEAVKDPEVPVISVVELGVVRNIEHTPNHLLITITPTYSGCPAMQVMEDDMRACLKEHGYDAVEFNTVLSPAWTTDWLTDTAKEKLREYGIAPPEQATSDKSFSVMARAGLTATDCGVAPSGDAGVALGMGLIMTGKATRHQQQFCICAMLWGRGLRHGRVAAPNLMPPILMLPYLMPLTRVNRTQCARTQCTRA